MIIACGVRYVMRISGISLKNDSRPLWIPSDDNDRFGFRVEARFVTVAIQGGGDSVGATKDDRSSQGKKTTKRVPVCGSYYCETRMDDIRAEAMWNTWREKPEADEATMPAVRSRAYSNDLWRELLSRELLRARNRKGARNRGWEDGCIILTTLRKLWQHSIIVALCRFPVFSSPPPLSLLPIMAMNRLSHP